MPEWLVKITEYAVVADRRDGDAGDRAGHHRGVRPSAVRFVFAPGGRPPARDVWLRYARWLVVGLTFQLAADIIETSIRSDWTAIGQLAAIAVIRTFLNYFLEKDLAEVRERQRETAAA